MGKKENQREKKNLEQNIDELSSTNPDRRACGEKLEADLHTSFTTC